MNFIIIIPLMLLFIFHFKCLNKKSESIYDIVKIKMDSLLLAFTYNPVVIDSFIVDNNILVDSKTKEFFDKVNKNNQSQFNELINAVNKNSLQFNKILASEDSRLSREMNSLNTWVTFWIGLFAILTIFIPIFTYLISTKDLNEKVFSMTNEIDANNAQLDIYTKLSVLKELYGQPPSFFDNEGRDEIVKDLLSGSTSKMKCIFENENLWFDKKTNQFNYTFKFLFREIKITMHQIQTYYEKREIIDIIDRIYKLSDDIIVKIDKPSHPDLKKELNKLLSLFDSLTGLISINNPDPR